VHKHRTKQFPEGKTLEKKLRVRKSTSDSLLFQRNMKSLPSMKTYTLKKIELMVAPRKMSMNKTHQRLLEKHKQHSRFNSDEYCNNMTRTLTSATAYTRVD